MVFCAFKVYTLFSLKQLIKFISSSNHYTLLKDLTKRYKRDVNNSFSVTWYLLAKYNHCHIVGTRTPIWVAHPLPPIQCCLQTVKAPIRKEFGQIVLSNIECWKGGVCANDLWLWLSVRDNLRSRNYASGSVTKEFEFSREKRGLLQHDTFWLGAF